MYTGIDDVEMVYEALYHYQSHLDEMEQLEEEHESAVSRLVRRASNY